MNYQLFNGDCLEVMDQLIEAGVKVDMILTDPPFGTTSCRWDSIIPFEEMWKRLNALIKDNGAITLFGAQPFTTQLIGSNLKDYKYNWYWIKDAPTGFSFVKYQPMRDVEDITVFYKKRPTYNPQGLVKLETPIVKKRKKGHQGEIYGAEGLTGKIYQTTHTNYPRNTLYFKPQRSGLHPTQKPVPLLEYLIKTYTQEGDVVLDFTMGSGSTGVAALNTGRKFIGIELDEGYFKIAKQRVEEVE